MTKLQVSSGDVSIMHERAAFMRSAKIFRVAGIVMSGRVHGLLVERAGGDRVDFASQAGFDRSDHITERSIAAPGVHASRHDRGRLDAAEIEHGGTCHRLQFTDHRGGKGDFQLLRHALQYPGVAEHNGNTAAASVLSFNRCRQISGPIPAGSPIVTARRGGRNELMGGFLRRCRQCRGRAASGRRE